MLPTRQLGAILRGRATRLQVMLATLLGGTLGFVPGFLLPGDLGGGFTQAPGLILLLLCLALIANANLAIFSGTLLLAKLASLPLLGVSYSTGTFLIDGPLQGLFRWLCNSQVTAWFGLEHYATTGGLVLGPLFGFVLGFVLNRILATVRRRMAEAEESSERYQKLSGKRSVRLVTWVFLGKGKGKKTWKELAESNKRGLPIRILGVIVAVVFVGSIVVFQQWFSTPILTTNLHQVLVAGNGATVDLESASLSLGEGVLRVKNLAMADSARLGSDLLAADELVFTIDTTELLRRRIVIDEVRATNARAGTGRAVPGVVIPPTEPPPPPEPPAAGVPTLDDYLAEYELWKQRLQQAGDWVDLVFGDNSEVPGQPRTPEEIARDKEEQLRKFGYAGVTADHLFTGGPRVLIRKIDIEGITWTVGGVQEKLALRLRNLSTAPSLVTETPSAGFLTDSQRFSLQLNGRSAQNAALGLSLACRGLPVDSIFSGLRLKGESPVRGGTIDLDCGGALDFTAGKAMTIDMPLSVTMKQTTFALPGTGATLVEQLALPIGVRGGLTRPSVYFDNKALSDALLAAGKQELAKFVTDNAGKLLGELTPKLPGELSGILDPSKSPEQMVDAAKLKLEEEKKKAQAELEAKAKKEAEKLLPGGLKGLFGEKKKDGKQ